MRPDGLPVLDDAARAALWANNPAQAGEAADRLRSMDGLELKDSLAVAVLENEVLFSVQDGPFAKCSQVWRWRIGSKGLEAVRNGLPEWLEGKLRVGGTSGASTPTQLTRQVIEYLEAL